MVCHLLVGVCCPLSVVTVCKVVVKSLLCIVWLSFAGFCLWFVVCRSMCVGCCLLFVCCA